MKADERAVVRVMRGLVGTGVVRAVGRDRYGATRLSDALCEESVRTVVLMAATDMHWRAWGDIVHAVRTGRTGFEKAFGMGLFEYLDGNRETGAVFDRTMAVYSASVADAVVRAYGWADVRTVVDVGGGRGGLLLPLLAKHPHLRGVLLERPRALRSARKDARALGVLRRCELVEGDFFRSVPRGGDVYLLRNIVHDWEDARALRILRNCRRAMGDASQLLIAEPVPPPGNRSWAGAWMDLDMLMLTGGRERTRAEHRALCAAAGLRVRRCVETGTSATILEVVRA
jgi:hypothetical protein